MPRCLMLLPGIVAIAGSATKIDPVLTALTGQKKQFDHNKAGTHAVKGKLANPWGLYDMLGNVYEWCEDAWSGNHVGADELGGPRPGLGGGVADRVVRGGSWLNDARGCRSAYRDNGTIRAVASTIWAFRPARGQAGMSSSKAGGAREKTGQVSGPEGRIKRDQTNTQERNMARETRKNLRIWNPFQTRVLNLRLDFFTIAVLGDAEASEKAEPAPCYPSDCFLSIDILSMDGEASFWSICVTSQNRKMPNSSQPKKGAIDYKEVLNAEDFYGLCAVA